MVACIYLTLPRTKVSGRIARCSTGLRNSSHNCGSLLTLLARTASCACISSCAMENTSTGVSQKGSRTTPAYQAQGLNRLAEASVIAD